MTRRVIPFVPEELSSCSNSRETVKTMADVIDGKKPFAFVLEHPVTALLTRLSFNWCRLPKI